MTDRSKFEEMLERLINEDRAGAEELFHEIVVEKSREIYQNIIESEDEDDLEEATDEEVDESEDDDLEESEDDDLEESDEEDLEEMFGLDEFEVEAPVMGGDATDDMMGDMGMDMDDEGDMDMDDEGEGDVEDRVADLEDALEDLRAEFEKLMGDDEGDDDMGDMDDEDDEEETKEVFAPAFEAKDKDKEKDKEKSKGKQTAAEQMREYVEKVSAKMGDNGVNNKSAVAGKNDMGGTTANIAKSFSTEKGGTQGGLANPSTKEDNAGNVNVPGGKAGKSMTSAKSPAKGDNGANSKSIMGS